MQFLVVSILSVAILAQFATPTMNLGSMWFYQHNNGNLYTVTEPSVAKADRRISPIPRHPVINYDVIPLEVSLIDCPWWKKFVRWSRSIRIKKTM
jgi:hypothetical protein